MTEQLFALTYDYVVDIAERRAPHREAHLAYLRGLNDAGRVVTAGATGDPVTGALIICRATSAAEVEQIVADDPYRAAGLLTGHRIAPWTVVIG